jgi:hypothetical protein
VAGKRMDADGIRSEFGRHALMLGFGFSQSTVSKCIVRGGSPSQSWKTFLRIRAGDRRH